MGNNEKPSVRLKRLNRLVYIGMGMVGIGGVVVFVALFLESSLLAILAVFAILCGFGLMIYSGIAQRKDSAVMAYIAERGAVEEEAKKEVPDDKPLLSFLRGLGIGLCTAIVAFPLIQFLTGFLLTGIMGGREAQAGLQCIIPLYIIFVVLWPISGKDKPPFDNKWFKMGYFVIVGIVSSAWILAAISNRV